MLKFRRKRSAKGGGAGAASGSGAGSSGSSTVQSGGPQSPDAGDGAGASFWDCSVCTFRNNAEAFKCSMCDVRKGTSTR